MATNDDDQKPDTRTTIILLDMSQAAVQRMIAEGRDRGYITYDQLNAVLAPNRSARTRSGRHVHAVRNGHPRGRKRRGTDDAEQGGGEIATTSSGSREIAVATTENRKAGPHRRPGAHVSARMGSVELCRARARSPSPSASRPAATP